MGLFGRDKEKRSLPAPAPVTGGRADLIRMASEMQASAVAQMGAIEEATAGTTAGSMTWARQVMNLIRPAEPGFVKRCTCGACGAPKQLPSVTAYVYCDFCGSLADYDMRRACESDVVPGPDYAATVNGAQPHLHAAQLAGDRDAYRAIQLQVYDAYVTNVPSAVSHRVRNDHQYRQGLIGYLSECAVVAAFDPRAVALTEEMRQRVISLRYGGSMMAMKVEPDSFWPVVDTMGRQIELAAELNRAAGVTEMDPDRAGPRADKLAWSQFCQGWLPMLPADAADQLLDEVGLKNEYVAVQVVDGQPRSCGGCGGKLHALPGATAIVCDGCGRTLDIGSAEIPCSSCGAAMSLPKGADRVSCPFCQATVEKVGIL